MDTNSNVRKQAGRLLRGLIGQEGNAILELALILPVFLALITGIGSFGIALANQQTLTRATGIGAQYLQTLGQGGGTGDPCADTFTAIKNAAPGLNPNNITVNISINGGSSSGGTGSSGASCSGQENALKTAGANQYPVTVSTTYPCNLSVYGYQFASSCQLNASLTLVEY